MQPVREFNILNPNGMKDVSTIQARPDVDSIVEALQERNWTISPGLYVAVQVDGYRWFAFTVDVEVETKTTYVGRSAR